MLTSGQSNPLTVRPVSKQVTFKTLKKLPRLGVMLVGWGGNNGSTLTAALLANKHNLKWETRRGEQSANYFGSIVMSTTILLGYDANNQQVYVPLRDMLPMVHPNDMVIGGWDISKMNLADAMDRAQVLEPDLKQKLRDEMSKLTPLPSVYYPDFIAGNQNQRADNVLPTSNKHEQLGILRNNIRDFKQANSLDKVIVVWTANTERFSQVITGVNDTADNLLQSISDSHPEIAPSTLFACASILESCSFINGSPQNTFVPGVIELATRHKVIYQSYFHYFALICLIQGLYRR